MNRFRSVRCLARSAVLAVTLSLAACATTGPVRSGPVEVQAIRMTAAGKFVDLRYRVTDPGAARQALVHPGVQFRLVNEKTGQVMQVPVSAKLGALRQTRGIKPGHTYFMLFQGGGLRRGDVVTAQLGDLTFRHLRIQ